MVAFTKLRLTQIIPKGFGGHIHQTTLTRINPKDCNIPQTEFLFFYSALSRFYFGNSLRFMYIILLFK